MRRRVGSRSLKVMVVSGLVAAGLAASPASADGRTHTVRPGESIQAAIDAARPGDTVKIKAGTYYENVYVNKNSIELKGAGARRTFLRPPQTPTPNPCVEGNEIFGAVCVGLAPTPVRGFELEGMTIEGFANGAFLVNTVGPEVEHMVFANNEEYGAFYNSSTGGKYHDNVAYGSGEAGLYFGDSSNAKVKVEDNEVYDNGFGLFLRDSNNGKVEDNNAHDNCFGIFLLNTGEPNAVTGWKVEDNKVQHNTKACPPSEEAPPISGGGIVLGGASRNVIEENHVKDNMPSGPSPIGSGGIVLFSTVQFGGTPTSGNRIEENRLRGNLAYDLIDDPTGTANRFDDNRCQTSLPAGLCEAGHH